MTRRLTGIVVLTLVAGFGAIADEKADREKLIGSWHLQGTPVEGAATVWMIAQSGDSLQITESEGDKIIAKFKCTTEGSACEIKTSGKKATVSMWYNGAKLVQMETKGSDVLKRRFGILPEGNAMEVEVIGVVPEGKTETFRYQRVDAAAPTN
jgi:hypothetical protein